MRPGRGWAYAGALLGGTVSVAANVAHSYVPPAQSGPGWQPPVGAVVLAGCWPLFLLTALEILARTPWPAGRRWVTVRWAGLGLVAAVAAIVSYRHLSGLLAWYGEDPVTSALGPLAVDGLMVMAAAALLATADTSTSVSIAAAVVQAPVISPAPAARPPSRPAAPRRPDDAAARDALVDQLAAQARTDPGWKPDYPAIRASLAAAGLPVSQSTAERVARAARTAAQAPAQGAGLHSVGGR